MAFTHKIGNHSFSIELTSGNGSKAGLTKIVVDGKQVDNFRTSDKGHRPGSALKGTYSPDFRAKYKMVEVTTGKGETIPAFPLSMKPEAVAKALVDYHYGATVAKAEAKAEAKAKAEAAKAEAAKAKAEAKVAK